jgi:hypothetical protein
MLCNCKLSCILKIQKENKMKQFVMAIALACVLSATVLAGTIPTSDAPAPPSTGNIPTTDAQAAGEIPSTDLQAAGNIPTGDVLTLILTMISLTVR